LRHHFPNSWLEIDLNAVSENVAILKKLNKNKKILAVVKSDAYGHGAVKCSKHLEPMVDWFGVVSVDEGIELRMGGIRKPILVMGVPDAESAATYVTHNLTATVSHIVHFSVLMDGTHYQLNFDTGMGRIGFKPSQADEVRQMALINSRLLCSGIYSHFASSDHPDSDFVKVQLERFKEIKEKFKEIPLSHISNTGALIYYDLSEFEMIRTGLGIWGLEPEGGNATGITPVQTLKSTFVQIRPVKKGEPVSYGSTWHAPADGFIGTIPVGYADGIPRSLSNKLEVTAGGKKYRVAGTVTMDFIMVWLENDRPKIGTEVELMGRSSWNAKKWADESGTIPYEILTGISNRVVRYYKD